MHERLQVSRAHRVGGSNRLTCNQQAGDGSMWDPCNKWEAGTYRLSVSDHPLGLEAAGVTFVNPPKVALYT